MRTNGTMIRQNLADKVFYAYAVTGKFLPELADLGLNYVIRLDLTIVEL